MSKEITHPKIFNISGMFFKVVSYTNLSDDQAANVAMMFYKSHKFTAKDKNKTFTIKTSFDKGSSRYL